MDKFCINPVREAFVIFKGGADFLKLQLLRGIIEKNHRMGISHGNAGDIVLFSLNLKGFIDDLFLLGNNGVLLRLKNGRSHVYPNFRNLSVFQSQMKILDTCLRLHCDIRLVHNAVIIGVFCHTTDAISAHSSLRTVQVIHIHRAVCLL